MFNVGDRVAIVGSQPVGNETRLRTIRIDVVEKITSRQILTNHARFDPETRFQTGQFAPAFRIAPLTLEHEAELGTPEPQTRGGMPELWQAEHPFFVGKRESLRGLFPESRAPEISMFGDGKFAITFRLSYSQVEDLAHLLTTSVAAGRPPRARSRRMDRSAAANS